MIVENTGDIPYDFELRLQSIPEWMNANLSIEQIRLNAGEINNQIYLNISIKEGTASGENANLVVELWVDGWNPGSVNFDVTAGDYFNWDLVEEISKHDYDYENRIVNVSVFWTLTNLGNTNDGLVVNLDCNVFTNYELDVPNNAEEQNMANPRSFEILDIHKGDSVNFTAWMNLSYDEISQSMFDIEKPTISIEARSIRDPRIIFEGSESELEDLFIEKDCGDCSNNNRESVFIDLLRTWQTVIISLVVILFGSIGVVKAIQYRLEEDRKRMGLPIEESENVNDWMARFTKKSEPKVIIESQTIDSEGFAKGFTKKSEDIIANNKLGTSKFLIEKASESLDKAMIDDTLDDIVELAEDLTEDRSIHPSNLLLEEQDFESRISNLRKNKKSNNED